MATSKADPLGVDASVRTASNARDLVQTLVFSGTLLVAAFLLFVLQPIFTKRVLPVLGGTPAVWSVATVVFQGLLLAGYAYAHATTRWLSLRASAIVHGFVLLAGFAFLPITVAMDAASPQAGDEALWLVGLFLASIGAPFFALSASAPLLQAWFSRSGNGRAQDPYFLYRASNLGSFAALIAYPLVIEPFLGLGEQTLLWSAGYTLAASAVAACALSVLGEAGAGGMVVPTRTIAMPRDVPSVARRLAWIGLSAVPSGLLVAVTAHITTDVAAIPLMWVLPLALYLLTFVVTFRPVASWPERPLAAAQASGTAIVLGAAVLGRLPFVVDLLLSLSLCFVAGLVAHRSVYRLRPAPHRLTEFYLCTSLGGMLGGLFAALIAPRLFSTVAEYPILLVAALACRPGVFRVPRAAGTAALRRLFGIPAGLFGLAALARYAPDIAPPAIAGVMMTALLLNWRAPQAAFAFAGLFCTMLLAMPYLTVQDVESRRSFFGVHRIATDPEGRFRLLFHGTTLHGAMRIREDDGRPVLGTPEPTTYYATGNAIADVLEVARNAYGPPPRVSVVGLGAGSLACQAHAGEAWTFYEIDPVVIGIARDPTRFRFLSACAPSVRIVQGDARLTLARAAEPARVLIVDAFSSDAIPMHLLTGEAFALYRDRLDAKGVLALHVSNQHFDLRPALARVAAEQGLTLLQRVDPIREPLERRYRTPAMVVIATGDPSIAREAARLGWTPVVPDKTRRPWTDDYANVLEAFLDMLRLPKGDRHEGRD